MVAHKSPRMLEEIKEVIYEDGESPWDRFDLSSQRNPKDSVLNILDSSGTFQYVYFNTDFLTVWKNLLNSDVILEYLGSRIISRRKTKKDEKKS